MTERMVFVAENGLRSDLIVYNFSWWEHAPGPLADACCVTHALSVPMLCPHSLLILATPLVISALIRINVLKQVGWKYKIIKPLHRNQPKELWIPATTASVHVHYTEMLIN